MNPIHKTFETNEQRVYFHLILLGLFLHSSETIIYTVMKCPLPAIYNIFSAIFYLIMIFIVRNKQFRTAVTCIHIESTLFVAITVLSIGWDVGTPYFLLAMASLVYFCPFDRKIVPYLFSVLEFSVFIVLRYISNEITPIYSHISVNVIEFNFYFNAIACLALILFAAYSANLSASVSNQKLLKENENLSTLASFDPLTGLLNRIGLTHQLIEIEEGTDMVLAIGDIDNFKVVNDTYGHTAGDEVLKTLGQVIMQCCSKSTISCRWGGEEIIFLFPNRKMESVKQELEALSHAINAQNFCYKKKDYSITITLGVARGNYTGSLIPLIEAADQKLYLGKQNGKNQIVY